MIYSYFIFYIWKEFTESNIYEKYVIQERKLRSLYYKFTFQILDCPRCPRRRREQ